MLCRDVSCRVVRRAQHARQVHRVVPQRDHAAGAVAAALPARRLHALQGIYIHTRTPSHSTSLHS